MLATLRRKNLHTWLGGYARHLVRRARTPRVAGPRHLLFALCDHYEPLHGDVPHAVGVDRVRAWQQRYPEAVRGFRDADGRPPRHSFFFPGEQYHPEFMDRLAELVRGGYGEVEVHLHHDGDTAGTLRAQLDRHLAAMARHGHLSRGADGRLRWAFIHGNWALANPRPGGYQCGVDDELEVLFDAGCYADFTFPSAPDDTQPNIVNAIYWPVGDLRAPRCYEHGEPARVGVVRHDRLLLIQGPLCLAYKPTGARVRIENGALTGVDPPTARRVRSWVAQNIHVDGRPEWVFVKVFTHGCPEDTAASLLGDGARALHEAIGGMYNDGRRWRLHYVTAREMYNVVRAALDGKAGDPNDYRDYAIPPPPVAT
ncbi:MAG: hypothetical protein D6689_13120 [Deltaproteobacteria bacterium]|nr:MAG: hypothetical protein D6689_13120 [Deltaproteobacteria bacterium]